MRIGQLARRLGVPPTEILSFLGTQNIDAEAGANARLSTENVAKVVHHFAPDKLSEILAVPAEEPVVEKVEVVEVVQEPLVPVVAEQPAPVEDSAAEPAPDAPVEVIRVAKVELQGLKVLGKIELPQKKKAESAETPGSEEIQHTDSDQRPPKREYQKRNERNDRRDREWRNPLEAKRLQEAREAEKKRKEEAERLKEKRTNHYYNKVKSVPTKAVRRVQEEVVVEDIEAKEPPKGIFGRFLKWLKT